jgi:uncharacterized membrane protein
MQISSEGLTGSHRLSEIDFLRSLAIVIMIYANSFPYAASFEPSGLLRLLMSLAAPLFIFLSGFTSTLNHIYSKSNLLTAVALLCSACLIDTVIWEIVPFYTFDVLYCIAASAFVNSIVRYTYRAQLFLIAASLTLYGIVRITLPYEWEISELSLGEADSIHFGVSISQALVNGWFPIIPWMSFAFLGRLYGMNRDRVNALLHVYRPALIIILCVAVLLAYKDSQSPMRMGYIEVFYPPSASYLLLAFLWIAALLSFRNRLSRIQPSAYYLNIGKSSLLIYMLHAAINHFIIEKIDPQLNAFGYGVLIASLLVFFQFFSILHQHFKKHTLYKSCPIFVRKIFGI